MSAPVTLKIEGTTWDTWEEVTIQRGMEQIAGNFSLVMSSPTADQDVRRKIRPDDRCELHVDDTRVIAGYVDDVTVRSDKKNHRLEVRGRDATGDLVDCSAVYPGGQFTERTLTQIATTLCEPFGIPVTLAQGTIVIVMVRGMGNLPTDAGTPFATFKIQQGETVFEALERAARQRGVLLVSDGAGGLVITRAGRTVVPTQLIYGQNILIASHTASHRERFSDYLVKGSRPGDDDGSGADVTTQKGQATDSGVRRHRPLLVLAEANADANALKTRADWEARVRFGRSKRSEITVQGWQHAGGLWQPNTRVPVQDPTANINAEMLISSVTFHQDKAGSRTVLGLVPPATFERIVLPNDADEDMF